MKEKLPLYHSIRDSKYQDTMTKQTLVLRDVRYKVKNRSKESTMKHPVFVITK